MRKQQVQNTRKFKFSEISIFKYYNKTSVEQLGRKYNNHDHITLLRSGVEPMFLNIFYNDRSYQCINCIDHETSKLASKLQAKWVRQPLVACGSTNTLTIKPTHWIKIIPVFIKFVCAKTIHKALNTPTVEKA